MLCVCGFGLEDDDDTDAVVNFSSSEMLGADAVTSSIFVVLEDKRSKKMAER